MRIVLEALVHEGQPVGLGQYARFLLEGLARLTADGGEFEFVLLDHMFRRFRDRRRELRLPDAPNISVDLRRFPRPLMQLLEERLGLRIQDRWVRSHGADLFHAMRGILPPMRGDVPRLATVHDLSHLHDPEWFEDVWYRRFQASVDEADRIIAVSQFTADDLVARCGADASKITVVHSGVNPAFRAIGDASLLEGIRARLRLPERCVLFVGGLRPIKNLPRLVRAMRIVRDRTGEDWRLVLTGRKAWKGDVVADAIGREEAEGWTHFTGYLSDGDLVAVYNLAEALAFATLNEGFGFPVLEAMACQTPVVASNTSSLPEVCGQAAEFVDPESVDSIAAGLERVLTDPDRRAELVRLGEDRARGFTWDRCVRRHLEIYRELARG